MNIEQVVVVVVTRNINNLVQFFSPKVRAVHKNFGKMINNK